MTAAATSRRGAGIFLSYRRDDAGGRAGRLYDRLAEHYGRDAVFMDIDAIGGGEDFPTTIAEALARSRAVIAMIGPGWTQARDGAGRRRLDDSSDFSGSRSRPRWRTRASMSSLS